MDFFIASPSAPQRLFRLGKGWGIQNDKIEPRFSLRQAGQVVKDVGSDSGQMEVVPLRVLLNGGDELAVDLDRSHGFSAGSRAGKRKSALIRKAVQNIQPARKAGDLAVVIDLIEVKTGLLPRE